VIYRIYEWLLKRQLRRLPGTICFMISKSDMEDAPWQLFACSSWCREISREIGGTTGNPGAPDGEAREARAIRSLTFHISTPDPSGMAKYLPGIRRIATIARLTIHCGGREEVLGEGMDVTVAIGMSGREEITECIRRMARDGVDPAAVNEALIDSYLTFGYAPDIVIKTGGDHLTDFLIWQSVYSELYFSDVNWKWFRKVDFLRVLRDYQSRARRFGK
jgi:undecaprenyl diphosphate synthase